MSILGNVGGINVDLKRTAVAIMRKLNSERIVQTPWVSRQSLQVSTRAVHTYFNQAILILQNNRLIEMNEQNEFQITHRGIADLEIMERQ
ncbi:MAG: hypothetical protein P0116_15275 [Candidatus Nitrosocosmicus sp.]|nr:hypothetical protein [Candidatus Nitrosocosmicus sp.]